MDEVEEEAVELIWFFLENLNSTDISENGHDENNREKYKCEGEYDTEHLNDKSC
jgi:hypothetical protein